MSYLPTACYTRLPSTNEVISVKFGEHGYLPCPDIPETADVDFLNSQIGVYPDMERAMRMGSMHGWDIPMVKNFVPEVFDTVSTYGREYRVVRHEASLTSDNPLEKYIVSFYYGSQDVTKPIYSSYYLSTFMGIKNGVMLDGGDSDSNMGRMEVQQIQEWLLAKGEQDNE